MKIWTGPYVELISMSPLPSQLVEQAGRICYMSQDNPSGRTNEEYIKNILLQQHGSVLEHAVFSFQIEGISRACSHELVRHRAGFSYSQLSQRYVGEEHIGFVLHPTILELDEVKQQYFINSYKAALEQYLMMKRTLKESFPDSKKKDINQVARYILPNATETKLVVTANARAWRHFIELRGSFHADPEIRRLACEIAKLLLKLSPELFQDVVVSENGFVNVVYHKV